MNFFLERGRNLLISGSYRLSYLLKCIRLVYDLISLYPSSFEEDYNMQTLRQATSFAATCGSDDGPGN